MSLISKKITNGVFFIGLSRYSNLIIQLIISGILARLLTPQEFGIVAIVFVFVLFFNMLSNLGLEPAIVQSDKLNDNDLSNIFSLSVFLGLFFSIVFFMLANFIGDFYNEKRLVLVIRLLSIAIFFNTLIIVPKSLIRKSLAFKKLGLISVLVQSTSGIIAVILAYYNFSYFSLLAKSILDSLMLFTIFYTISPIKFKFNIEKKSINKIFKFASFQFLFNFINYFSRNLDNLLIAKYFNVASLAIYDKSYRLVTLPTQNITHIITPVLLPVIAKYKNDKDKVFLQYLQIVKILAYIGFSLSIFLFFSANELINIVFGSQWFESIPVFQLLALTVCLQILISSTGAIFQAMGRVDLLFFTGILVLVFMCSGIYYGIFIKHSLVSIGYGLIVAFSINFLIIFFTLIKIVLKSSFIRFINTLLFPVFIALCVGITLYYCSPLIEEKNMLLSLILKMILSIAIYFLIFCLSAKNRVSIKHIYIKYFNK